MFKLSLMRKKYLYTLALLVFSLCSLSLFIKTSSVKAHRAFYYWKTKWEMSPEIKNTLVVNDVDTLYLRFFDVEWETPSNSPKPVAPIIFLDELPQQIKIIPVVYLKNEVFKNLSEVLSENLAENIWMKISIIAKTQHINISQIQMDCDWSPSTRQKYFKFLQALNNKLKNTHIKVSATIRLHQVKYREITGVPPVNRGMLMFYNFGRLQARGELNSIFNEQEASRYTSYISEYPLPLDVVLPIFSWAIHSHHEKITGLLEKTTEIDLNKNHDQFQKGRNGQYIAKSSFFFRGNYFYEGDILNVEKIDAKQTSMAAQLVLQATNRHHFFNTIAFFDLDERNLNHYENDQLKNIFNRF